MISALEALEKQVKENETTLTKTYSELYSTIEALKLLYLRTKSKRLAEIIKRLEKILKNVENVRNSTSEVRVALSNFVEQFMGELIAYETPE